MTLSLFKISSIGGNLYTFCCFKAKVLIFLALPSVEKAIRSAITPP